MAAALALAFLAVTPRVWAQAGPAGPAVAAVAPGLASRGEIAALHLDSELSDAVWQTAQPVSAFVQREPSEGMPATFHTEARVAYDSTTLYVSVRADDPEPDKIIAFLTRRDTDSSSDWIRVLIDSYHDRRTAYEFAVNPLGVKRDIYRFNDGDADESWDAVWDVTVGRDAEGWHAQFRIPLSQLRFSRNGGGRLGFAVVREIARLNETATWPLLAKSASGYVSNFGELTGVGASGAAKRLELTPYVVGQMTTQPVDAGNPLGHRRDNNSTVGADVKYAITPALNLTATVNPDFGQVEADPATVNLSAFETFFEERRPFFVEGSGIYRFSLNCLDGPCSLFYSRRIGRQPHGSIDTPDGAFSSSPVQTTILGAGKLTGRAGPYSIGVLSAVTQQEDGTLAIGAARTRQVVEPQTAYTVARVRREYDDQSSVGVMLTSTNRQFGGSPSFLPDSSVVAAGDFEWRFRKRFNIEGYWAASTVRGSAQAISDLQTSTVHSFQRPDAGYLTFDPQATTLNGHHGSIAFNKLAGRRIRFNANVAYKTPGFDVNDLGFLRRADEINQSNWLQVRWDKPGRFVRTLNLNLNQWSAHNFAGDRIQLGSNVNAHWTFQNFWSSGFGVNFNARPYDDRLTRGGPGGYGTGNVNSWQYFNSDDRKLLQLRWDSFVRTDGQGSHSWEVVPRFVLRPASALYAEIGIRHTRNVDASQWVEQVTTDRDHYVFGHLQQTTSSLSFRTNYTIRPTLSVQLYAQPFVSAGDYVDYNELTNGRAPRLRDRYSPFDYQGNADFRYLSFRTTNVLRWEFKPGSALFVVWQQGREGSDGIGRFRFGHDYRDVFATPATSTFLVKLAYWLNP